MVSNTYNPAQIQVDDGLHVHAPPDQTPTEWGTMVDKLYHGNARQVFTHTNIPDAMDPHAHKLQ